MRAKPLFTSAAAFNGIVGVVMLLGYDNLAPWLALPPRPTVWIHIVALIVLVFGYAYGRIAFDPVKFREYIALGIVAKLAFVVAIYAHFAMGSAPASLALLVSADLIYVALFTVYLKTAPAPVEV